MGRAIEALTLHMLLLVHSNNSNYNISLYHSKYSTI